MPKDSKAKPSSSTATSTHSNLLWTGGQVTGVVDWEFACIGPVELDVSKCRVNIAVVLNADAADSFLRSCGAFAEAYDKAWDLDAIASLLGNPDILTKGNEIGGRLTPSKIRAELLTLLYRAVA